MIVWKSGPRSMVREAAPQCGDHLVIGEGKGAEEPREAGQGEERTDSALRPARPPDQSARDEGPSDGEIDPRLRETLSGSGDPFRADADRDACRPQPCRRR